MFLFSILYCERYFTRQGDPESSDKILNTTHAHTHTHTHKRTIVISGFL